MTNKAYQKLLTKLESNIQTIEQQINLLPDVDLSNLLMLVVKNLLKKSNADNNLDIDEIYHQLNSVRGKALSAIDTYSRTTDPISEQKYLAQLRHIMNEVTRLERILKTKDIGQFFVAKNHQHVVDR